MSPGRVLGPKTMRAFLPSALLLASALALAPSGLAQEETGAARPDDAAWVEECPADMLCAASAPPDAESHAGQPDARDSPQRDALPGASLAAALGILAVAGIGVALLPRA